MPDKGKSRSSRRGRGKTPKRPTREQSKKRRGVPPGPPWEVRFHPEARKEALAIRQDSEGDYESIMTVIEKLKINGPGLGFPHQSAVQGTMGDGLRELRPAQGRTLRRPLYRRFENTYVILAVGPEAKVDQAGFDSAVSDAQSRRQAIEATL